MCKCRLEAVTEQETIVAVRDYEGGFGMWGFPSKTDAQDFVDEARRMGFEVIVGVPVVKV